MAIFPQYTFGVSLLIFLYLSISDISLVITAVPGFIGDLQSVQDSVSDLTEAFSIFEQLPTYMEEDNMPIAISNTTKKIVAKEKTKINSKAILGGALVLFSVVLVSGVIYTMLKRYPEYAMRTKFQAEVEELDKLSKVLHEENGDWIREMNRSKVNQNERDKQRERKCAEYKEQEYRAVYNNARDVILHGLDKEEVDNYRNYVWNEYTSKFVAANDSYTFEQSMQIFSSFQKYLVAQMATQYSALESYDIHLHTPFNLDVNIMSSARIEMERVGTNEDSIRRMKFFTEKADGFARRINRFHELRNKLSSDFISKYNFSRLPNDYLLKALRGETLPKDIK